MRIQDTGTQAANGTGTETHQDLAGAGTMDRMYSGIEQWLVTRGPGVLLAVLLLVVAWLIAGSVRRLVIAGLTRTRMDLTLAKFFGNLSRWGIILFAAITCMGTLGINTTSLAALVGAIGLAIGLALQGNLGNLASGVLLLIFRPFKIGDTVVIAGQSGIVDGIDLFTTNLDTPDNRRIIVPNNAILNGVIENQSRHPRRRADVTVQVAYWADAEEVRRALAAAAARVVLSTPGGIGDPPPRAVITEVFPPTWTVQAWAETTQFGAVRSALVSELKSVMDTMGIYPVPLPAEARGRRLPDPAGDTQP